MLDTFLPGDRRRALAGGWPLPDPARGAVLFADISGFTPLSELLDKELGPRRGSEELTRLLDRLFEGLVDALATHGGEVIYFSGDAITCWLADDDGTRAIQCALSMQQFMADHGEVATARGAARLAAKVAVACGVARRFVIGDPSIQLIDVLAGRVVDDVAAAEQLATRGEVLADESVLAALGDALVVAERRRDGASGRTCGVVTRWRGPAWSSPAVEPPAPLAPDVVRTWILASLHDRLAQGALAAEFRPVCSLFLRVGLIDVDDDPTGVARLDDFIRDVQRVLAEFGGNLLQLTIGDKGAYVFAVFGAPVTHEDDAARACRAALRLRALATPDAAGAPGIGLTYGRLYSGTYGHPQRRAFACMGDPVNLAARLMAQAPAGAVFAESTVVERAGPGFDWAARATLTVRGKAQPVAVHALQGVARAARRVSSSPDAALIGRRSELDTLQRAARDAIGGQGRVVGIAAEAGVGKSRLVDELVSTTLAAPCIVARGACEPYGKRTGYFAWRDVWTRLLDVDTDAPVEAQVNALRARIVAIDPALDARVPLLAPVLDLPIPDSVLTASFDPKLRKASLEDLMVVCLQAIARRQPVAIVLEDCHWIDELSRDLVHVIGRILDDLPVLVIATYRPPATPTEGLGATTWPRFVELALGDLPFDDARALIGTRMAAALPPGRPPSPALVGLIEERTQGNPFYIGELVRYLASQGIDLSTSDDVPTLDLPDTLHSLVLSRIDGVAEAPRRTLKVASVLGREFEAPSLPLIHPPLGTTDDVRAHLGTLAGAGLVDAQPRSEAAYAFRHAITREVAYESLVFSMRARLHEAVGRHIESGGTDVIERSLDVLAHHYWRADDLPKKREYLERAGIAAQAAYANRAAIDYFDRLVPLLEGRERVDVMLKLVKVLELLDWTRAQSTASAALDIAAAQGDALRMARAEIALAELARKQGRYDDARARLDRAASTFVAADDQAGLGEVRHLAGTLAAQRGDYERAVEQYEASLAIRRALGDKSAMGSLYSNLGVVAEYRGDLAASRAHHEHAMQLRRETGDRRGIGVSTMNIGMTAFLQKEHAEARDWFRQALVASRDVGDAWMVALSNHNLGNAARAMGDYAAARRHYADSLAAFGAFQDRWAYAFLLEDIGMLAALEDDPASALELLGAADSIRTASETPRAPSLERELDEQLASAIDRLPAEDRARLRQQGRELDFAAAVARARATCERPSAVMQGAMG